MKRILFTIGLSILFILSCEKEESHHQNGKGGLEIMTGTICGWCAGVDSLIITEDKMNYHYINPCDESDYFKDTITEKSKWDELIKLIDLEEFLKITINTCYVCVDGCDTWISIKNDSTSHTIRFGYSDSLTIQNIKPFVDKLDSIRTRFRNEKNE